MARTVEAKYGQAIEQAYIATWMLNQGTEPAIEERIEWAIARLEEAREYHRKVVKKQQKEMRDLAAHCARRSGT
jgi:cellobiose-specific phosphotransferase system component IIA